MTKSMIVAAAAVLYCSTASAEKTPPPFPKLSVEYSVSIPVLRMDKASKAEKVATVRAAAAARREAEERDAAERPIEGGG